MHDVLPGTRLLDREELDDPYPFYRDLHRYAPVWHVPRSEVYLVSSYTLLAEATARVADFSSNLNHVLYRDDEGLPRRLGFGEGGINVLATADPPLHSVHKSSAFPNFAVRRMALLEREVVEVAERYVDYALSRRTFDFMAEIANQVPITIISRLVGFRNSDSARLFRSAIDSTDMLAGAVSLQQLQDMISRTDDISNWIAGQLELAGKEPDEDILTAVSRGIRSGAFTLRAGIVMLHTFLSAGGESTTSLLGNAVRILADDPALQNQVRANPHLIPGFLEEVLRIESPFRCHLRSVPKDTVLGGSEIRAGATVLMSWGAGNRDPAIFEKPDEFMFGRAPRHFAFGRGIHFCIGAPLARLEARVVLAVLLAKSRDIRLDPNRPPKRVASIMVRRYDQLYGRRP
jgi:cytochrome P450